MKYDYLMVHYGELGTKGDNRRLFISQLGRNIRHALKAFEGVDVKVTRDHTYVSVTDENFQSILSRLEEIPGIQKISLVYKSEKDIETIRQNALSLIKNEEGKTFKADVTRTDKTYPLDSYHIACAIGDYVLSNSDKTVDVHNPEIRLSVELRDEACYLSSHSFPGAGGYPLGMNGKVMMLLSGGIDSPAAAYLLLRRGVRIECIHFAAPPYTSEAVIDKLTDIIKRLNVYQEDIKLNIVPFTKLQLAIYANVDEPYCITVMRRMMFRIADKLAKKHRCLGIATGESIGQVASQTLDSMIAINDVTNFPIIRPLAVSDKLDAISIAKKIKTYDISIRPYEDCCTIFKPKKPKTKPRVRDCEFFEKKFDWAPLVDECVENVTSILMVDGKKRDFSDKQPAAK
ncbi:MAG: tRNA 4-thiouridine(8) synthase ThiI [Bacilli bacterium]|jgi:thiamine biosynthesis protein ThiI|nr:tRNA 4-thiouridine(8) synthase ThiI [Bacilli bacterium]MCH4210228.1 tRNA 4-thiouridine(8) synthase ThiI [Bacilli bacterium]MCH4228410.1 tRNA 4-thiouridine(8) synthase ThiI [Bacilli bacterium]MCH4278038.1 tRNA 4-thiouridine(8) synthase ThiI [Bacilli bacterium]MCI2054909.1 tRNA 4-thiouridine(8) synthase ThiI [Bacilli bacterium]